MLDGQRSELGPGEGVERCREGRRVCETGVEMMSAVDVADDDVVVVVGKERHSNGLDSTVSERNLVALEEGWPAASR